jgi:serine/threonine protein kinase
MSQASVLAPGTYVREWKVIQRLGEARHGPLYAVGRADRTFALKWLAPSLSEPPKALAEREAACLRLLRGPLFAALEAHGVWPQEELGTAFLVMEAIPGMRFSKWFHQSGPTARDMAHVFMGIASAVSEMHKKGVRYPTLSSADVTIREGRLEPVFTDLGGAFLSWGAPTKDEIAEDMRAVGMMFYEALTRQRPGLDALPVHVVNPRVPRALSEVVMKLLLPDPAPGSCL